MPNQRRAKLLSASLASVMLLTNATLCAFAKTDHPNSSLSHLGADNIRFEIAQQEETPDPAKVQTTISVPEADIQEHSFKIYQIFSATYAQDAQGHDLLGDFQWGQGVDSARFIHLLQAIRTSSQPGADYVLDPDVHDYTAEQVASRIAAVMQASEHNDFTNEEGNPDTTLPGSMDTTLAQAISRAAYQSRQTADAVTIDKEHTSVEVNPGYYLIVDQDYSESHDVTDTTYSPAILAVFGKEVTIQQKISHVPVVDKKVSVNSEESSDHTDASFGDIVTYTIDIKIPSDSDKTEKYEMIVADTISSALDLTGKIDVKYYPDLTKEEGVISLDKGTHYTDYEQAKDPLHTPAVIAEPESGADPATGDETGNGSAANPSTPSETKQAFAFHFDNVNDFVSDAFKGDDNQGNGFIRITYQAKLKNIAGVGLDTNDNTVSLLYPHSPYVDFNADGGRDETTDTSRVYAFELDFSKISNDAEQLEGAEFELQRTITNPAATPETPEADKTITQFASFADDGTFAGWVSERITDAESSTQTTFISGTTHGGAVKGADGKFIIKGIEAGTYTLTETKAPAGYSRLKEPVIIQIDFNAQEDGSSIENPIQMTIQYTSDSEPVDIELSKAGIGSTTITNVKNGMLPETGGMGSIILIVGGLGFAGICYAGTRKRHKDQA